MLMYFGQDGYHITSWRTWEGDGEDSDDNRAYMKALYDLAAERGYLGNLRMGLHAMNTTTQSGERKVTDTSQTWLCNLSVPVSFSQAVLPRHRKPS